jgi:hypothetical protein
MTNAKRGLDKMHNSCYTQGDHMTNHLAMPKIIRINIAEVNQHENILGKDEDNSRLDKYSLEAKHRAALKLFDAVAGHGVRGA